jgi:hypothetical protein
MERKKEKIRTAEQEEMLKFVSVILVVLACVGGIYLLTRAFVTKDLFNKDETKESSKVEVNYKSAIVGNIMNRPYNEYYVMVYDTTSEAASELSTVITNFENRTDEAKLHMYIVDLHNKLNADFYNPEKENKKATGVSNFMFGDRTLLKIKGGKVEKYITDLAKINEELNPST